MKLCAHRILSGEMHYPRIPRPYWRARLRMARALGVNAISTYVFWNRHEPQPGTFDFAGENDVAAYVRAAQEEGLDVILRPGPYVCAEWDFGGLPAWLLRDEAMRVRTTDEAFLAPVRRWLRRLGEELAALQRISGGPIIAVQLENEYGAYGSDSNYLRAIRAALCDAGFSASPLFTIDQPGDLAAGSLTGVPIATTFAPGDPAGALAGIRKLRPDAPLLCGEYWAGWFDHWGEPHALSDDAQQAADLEWMLQQGASVNIYMLHGGTNFGFWNGANATPDAPYQPTTTSYDYRAAIDEAGRPTPKYFAFRAAIERVTNRTAPLVPPAPQTIAVAAFELNESAPLENALPPAVCCERPLSMEHLGQSFGYVLYRTIVKGPFEGTLTIEDVRDYAVVSIDGRIVARLDRRLAQSSAPVRGGGDATLDILVENSGRMNYGAGLAFERKGITRAVRLNDRELLDWRIYPLALETIEAVQFTAGSTAAPAFYRGRFHLDVAADTFLDVRDLRKGAVWVNGRNAGRVWDIGPARTLYVPGTWLHPGSNAVVAFDLFERDSPPSLRGLSEPVFQR